MALNRTLRLAVLGVWHVHAKDHVQSAQASPAVELLGVWDRNPESAKAAAAAWGIDVFEDLDAIWENRSIDGVIVTTDTASHLEIITAAAKARKHVFTEKVIAATVREVDQILSVVDEARIHFGVTLPRIFAPYTQTLKRFVQNGDLGKIVQARLRISHNGALSTREDPNGWLPEQFFRKAEAQGGALIDLGAHPLYLSLFFFGFPETVYGKLVHETGKEQEDAATVLLGYKNGPLVTCEVSFCAPYRFSIEILGTTGTATYVETRNSASLETETIALPRQNESAPVSAETPFDRWVDAILEDRHDEESPKIARELTALIEQIYGNH
jgi:1,5-anhydro-D-fructose reductase (1,5-anhydro-D-mannitol-forming)